MAKDANSKMTKRSNVPEEKIIDKATDNDYWPRIAHRDEIPTWLRDNDYILTGHPMPTHSYQKSYRLWRCLHMETMNIWTHLLGSIAFLVIAVLLSSNASSRSSTSSDVLAIMASTLSAVICFGLSANFHTLRSHSYNVHHFWGKMDILGICFLAFGGGISIKYYAFYGQPGTQRAYWALSIFSSLAAAYTLFDTGGGGSKMRTLRGSVFSLLVLSAMLPVFHCVYSRGWDRSCSQIGAQWLLAEALTLLVAVTAFVGRMPERFSPGSFDIWGHSHQIFHTLAVVGTFFHLRALLQAYEYQHSTSVFM